MKTAFPHPIALLATLVLTILGVPAFVDETTQPDGLTVITRDLAPANAGQRFIRLRVLRLP